MTSTQDSPVRVASFFAGIGGFDLAFENAGCQVIFQCEIDDYCRKVLRRHWPKAILAKDIRPLILSDIPEAEVWCAGFPCQDLSLANQGKRQGLKGERSGLFTKFAQLAASALPDWIVLENVPGLLNSGDGEDFRYVLQTLDDLGYFVAWRVLDAKYFGTPQDRRRIFIVASHRNDGAARVLFGDNASSEMVGASPLSPRKPSDLAAGGDPEPDLYTIQHATIGRKPAAGPQGRGYRSDRKSYTLDSRGSSNVICAPDDGFRVRDASGISRGMDSRRLSVVGNAVCVAVAQWIAHRLVKADKQIRLESPTSTDNADSGESLLCSAD